MGQTASAEQEFAKVKELHQKADEDIASKMPGKPPDSSPP